MKSKNHGGFNFAFNHQCNCNDCVVFRREYLREFRLKQRANFKETGKINKHGTMHSYNLGCRCAECKKAQQDRYKSRNENRTQHTSTIVNNCVTK